MNFKEKAKSLIHNKIVIAIIFLTLPLIIEFLASEGFTIDKAFFVRIAFLYGIYVIAAVLYLLNKKSEFFSKVFNLLIKYRYLIALIILIILVLFKVNFSSIDSWKHYTNEEDSSNVVSGQARAIRSDEWLVNSPLMLGQAKSDGQFPIYNENIAQGGVNLLMVNVPVKDVLALVRPFSWGFLIFGEEYGFSFYWSLKIVSLFMVSLELMLKISKKDKLMSITGAVVLALAPAMMWWLSTAVVDSYIFGTAAIILFSYYMNNLDWRLWKKILIAIGLVISISAFAFALYPAFQVPFAFIMAIFMLNDFIPNIKKLKLKDVLLMIITIILIALCLIRFVLISWNDIGTMLGTVYPGERFETGGTNTISFFIGYLANIFFAYTDAIQNPCELSTYIYPFIGLIILIIYNLRSKKGEKRENTDRLRISLTCLYILFLVWEFLGFKHIFAKITFMYFSPVTRTHIALGILGVILCYMFIKTVENKKIFTKLQAASISFFVTMLAFVLLKNSEFALIFTTVKYEAALIALFLMTYFLIRGNKEGWCFTILAVAIVAGINVNPISVGTKPINGTNISAQIQDINQSSKNSLWIANTNIAAQYLVANGINTLNGVHTYPNFEWLNKVDPNKEYEEIYNRFAHISVFLGDETRFELISPDAYRVILTKENIKDLGVKYYYCIGQCSDEIIEEFELDEIYADKEKGQYIYLFNN